MNIVGEKKTKQNSLYTYGIILCQCREDHKNTYLESMLGLSSMSFGWLFLCHGSVWHISAPLCSLKGEFKTDPVF